MSIKQFDIEEKFPRIVVVKISQGFMVGIFPENKEIQKMMSTYMKEVMGMIQGMDGEDWKQKVEKSINNAIKEASNDNIKLYACKDVFEVMSIIAPIPQGDKLKEGKPDLSWFWSDEGHIPD